MTRGKGPMTLAGPGRRHRTNRIAIAAARAREAGCEWLHVDFEDHLADFYFRACGFRPTRAGLIRLRGGGWLTGPG